VTQLLRMYASELLQRHESAGLLMHAITEHRFGAPLFLFALTILREAWQARVGVRDAKCTNGQPNGQRLVLCSP
jgi:hypothetical protein